MGTCLASSARCPHEIGTRILASCQKMDMVLADEHIVPRLMDTLAFVSQAE